MTHYDPIPISANGSAKANGVIGGFICVTSGTLTIVNSAGTTILNAFPVTAGQSHPFSIFVGTSNATVTLAGGASGTLCF